MTNREKLIIKAFKNSTKGFIKVNVCKTIFTKSLGKIRLILN